jgi:small conductance mechanosensitive channel
MPDFSTQALEWLITYGPNLLFAVGTLIVGLWVIRMITKIFSRVMGKAKVDISLQRFLASLVGAILKVLLFISVIDMVGIKTTSFVAIVGAAGLAVGLALQGSLANFAGGVLILLFKPFKVGDFIEAQGYAGSVKAIRIFNTILKTGDNKNIFIPNGPLSGGSITNYSTETTRRVDMVFGIGYDDDIKKTKDVLYQLIKADERILDDPAPLVVVSELADSSVNFTVRVWCKSADYWGIYFDMHENVKLEFDKQGISIPFPQQDVHLHTVMEAQRN